MSKALGNSWIVIVVSAAMLLVVAVACSAETVEVPGETVVVEKEVVKEVMVPGETVVVEKVVTETVEVPGQTVVVEKVVTETVEVPGQTVTVEVVKEVMVPGETVVVEKEVVKEVMVPGQTVVVEKEVVKEVMVPGQTVVVEKEVVKEVMVPGQTVVVEKEVVKEVMVPGETVVVEKVVIQEVEAPAAMPTGPYGTLNVGWGALLGRFGLHPEVADSNTQFYSGYVVAESLAYRNPSSEIEPLLAKSWSTSDDGLVWTFNLVEGVQFHQGYGEMTADDVISSTASRTGEGSLIAELATAQRLWAAPDGWVKALDDYTIEVNTGVFQWDMLPFLAGLNYVFSKKQVEELGKEAASVVGATTGPWEISTQRPGKWTFAAVEDHWRKTPEFAELVYWEMPEEATRVANFQVGKLDVFKMDFDSLETIKNVPGTKFMRVDGVAIEHVALMGQWYSDPDYNCDPAWISCDPDPNSAEWEKARKLREALAISFDRQLIVDEFLQGEGKAEIHWGWELGNARANLEPDIKEWPFDPERAKQLMAEAGYPDGFDITVGAAIRGVSGEVQACEYMASAWEEIGINTTIVRLPWTSFLEQIVSLEWLGAECHGTSARVHPSILWGTILSSARAPWYGVWHPVLDELIPTISSERDEAKRWAISNEVTRFLHENVLEFGTYSVNALFPVGPAADVWSEHMHFNHIPSRFEYTPHRK